MKRALAILILLISFQYGMAQKTDIVILRNGDKITGEVKKLELDILQLKTNTMSTVQIKWYQVSNIYAPDKYVQIELKDRTLIFGNLDTINLPGVLRLVSEIGEFNIPVEQVVSIFQVKQEFWNRYSGSLGAGISFTKASEVLQANYNANITYTDKIRFAALDLSSIRTQQPERDISVKEDYSASFNRTVLPRQFANVFMAAQRNTELGIFLRTMGGLGYGVDVIHTAIAHLRITASGIVNKETTLEERVSTENGEGRFSMDARIFKYTDPEIYLTAVLNWYPSFTVPGRNRYEADVKLRFEVVNNLFLEFKVYYNADSKPASETASKEDYGLLGSLQYTFGL